ncbi:hypothetical protein [Streptomyces albipurpureus]|uniref:Uncharacterized protein n=1 Tax=Streptomyces albipurpureus TaxID=2897419 RepID=A0ABT0UIR0_9ACTN|nr:hypothetical protein [Streptomyces sp. CWNU-1]MCM2388334.1 hypothetical protein [Streptomyces sp. CWNU-1]
MPTYVPITVLTTIVVAVAGFGVPLTPGSFVAVVAAVIPIAQRVTTTGAAHYSR